MIAQTLSDKLALAHSVLEIRDPYDECHFLQIEKEQGDQRGSEGLWLRAGKYEVFVKSEFDWEMATVLCCSPHGGLLIELLIQEITALCVYHAAHFVFCEAAETEFFSVG